MTDATNTNDELYPIAVLIDELKVSSQLTTPAPPERFNNPIRPSACSQDPNFDSVHQYPCIASDMC